MRTHLFFHTTTRLIAGAFLLLFTAGFAAPASAHTELVGSTPGDSETLEDLPKHVVLTFSQDIASEFVVLTAQPEGGRPNRLDVSVDGARVLADVPESIRSTPSAGAWTLAYRVTSADGHPIDGRVNFTLNPAASETPTSASSSPATEPSTTETPAPTGTDDADSRRSNSDDAMVPASLLVIGGISVAGVATALFLLNRPREDGIEP